MNLVTKNSNNTLSLLNQHMFLYVNKLLHFNGALLNKYCKERIEAKVGVYMCLLKLWIITKEYCRLMVNNWYNI